MSLTERGILSPLCLPFHHSPCRDSYTWCWKFCHEPEVPVREKMSLSEASGSWQNKPREVI